MRTFYTKEEKKFLFEENEIMYAEIAHQYGCCDLPELKNCEVCDIVDGCWGLNKGERDEIRRR